VEGCTFVIMKNLLSLATLWMLCSLCCTKQVKEYAPGREQIIKANRRLLEIAMEDGFSPPVASRVYVYPYLAFHAVLEDFYPDSVQRICTQVSDFPHPDSSLESKVDGRLAALMCFEMVAKLMVFSEPLASEMLQKTVAEAASNGCDPSVIDACTRYAEAYGNKISAWIKLDQYAYTRTLERYTSNKKPESWRETPPDYTPGLEPHWRKIRKIILDSTDIYACTPLPPFSVDKTSDFYQLANEVYSQVLDSSKIKTAWYWDDNPNVSRHNGHLTTIIHKISPPGHWLNITAQLCQANKTSLWITSDALTLTAIAMFNGIIDCWDMKYQFNTVRPVSYINENISQDWQPLIQTPPFPEFTSGHSVVSAAAAEVLSQIFGNQCHFTDSTEVLFGHPPRNFTSFHEAAMEVSLSRFYGGIHYRHSVLEGNKQGTYIARQLMKKIQFKSLSQ